MMPPNIGRKASSSSGGAASAMISRRRLGSCVIDSSRHLHLLPKWGLDAMLAPVKALSIILMVSAAFGLELAATPAEAAPRLVTDQVLVTAVSRDPCCGSGVILFLIEVSGRTRNGDRSYFIPFMVSGQPKPPIGGQCTISWRWWDGPGDGLLADGAPVLRFRWVESFDCD